MLSKKYFCSLQRQKKILTMAALSLCLTMNVSFAAEGVAKAELDQELSQMIGDTGTKVPGLGVIAFKGQRASPLPVTAASALPRYPRCLPSLPSCSWWNRGNWIWTLM